MMPHQEARFLLPIFFPVIFIFSDKFKSAGKGFWTIFTVFNLVGFTIFGIFHQGGIIPVLSHIQHEINEPVFCSFYDEHIHCRYSYSLKDKEIDSQFKLRTNLIFYKTYMPPQHLLTMRLGDEGTSAVTFVDLAGAPLNVLQKTVNAYHGVSASAIQSDVMSNAAIFKITPNGEFERTLLVAPSVVDLGPLKARLKIIHQQWGHLNTDYFDRIIQDPIDSLYLNVYTLLDSTD
ncbi:hypothetical protein K493DRAFT_36083 [Basidiobolus meristosporus CBS 931.73]|uniref:Uncharacterized protein n=1 Tax=Basidiobolus meristosporus CBS 931.73 TaxID=1314790 RepID=A0A1Y1Y689_9FUNG|nr:hypothetical protein K493DRAFT_36083 [Basidiobolus meristosporus CBS 931.73]|eukprot:ORX93541.1 hypothetical protein K493DRAFT_36083 [Basidiobolus meristosporus CBS 931.73]